MLSAISRLMNWISALFTSATNYPGSRVHSRFVQATTFGGLVAGALLLPGAALSQSPVAVRHTEGDVHGFLVLETLQGNTLAAGDVTQVVRGDRITSRLVFHFKDGSTYEEDVVFSQRHSFRLISDHLLQKGPAFNRSMEVLTDGSTGQITVHYSADDGEQKAVADRLKLPPDIVASGMLMILLKNMRPDATQMTVSMVAATPKPRLVKLEISADGQDPFSVGGAGYNAARYVIKVNIGGVAGVVAPLVGKQPQDTRVWILGGDAPVFVKLEGPLYEGGPTWRIKLASPVWQTH
jgi:hypothetical protein